MVARKIILVTVLSALLAIGCASPRLNSKSNTAVVNEYGFDVNQAWQKAEWQTESAEDVTGNLLGKAVYAIGLGVAAEASRITRLMREKLRR